MTTLTMSADRAQQSADGVKTLTFRREKKGDIFQPARPALNYPAKVVSVGMATKWQAGGVYGIKLARTAPVCLVDEHGKVVTDLYAEYCMWSGVDLQGAAGLTGKATLKWVRDTLLKWRLGYSLLQVRIQEIEPVDVRRMHRVDAVAAGFKSVYAYLETWCEMHDPKFLEDCQYNASRAGLKVSLPGLLFEVTPNVHNRLFERPDALYEAWRLQYERVKA